MKRTWLVLVIVAVGVTGWVMAQPPSAEPPEPPVRLKKKKKTPPAGAEQPGPEKPPARPEDPKEPDRPTKPKREDEHLDNKDDLKLPEGEMIDEEEILQRVAKNARVSEERLASREVGEGTRQVQDDIVKDIDKLIERSKQNNQNDQNQQNQQNQKDQANQGGRGGSGGQGASGSSSSRQRRQARRQRRRGSSGTQTARRQGNQGRGQTARNDPPRGNGLGQTPGGNGAGGQERNPPDRGIDLWGHLPERERQLMNKEMEQKFMDKYDELTKQYYRIIAEKSRPKK